MGKRVEVKRAKDPFNSGRSGGSGAKGNHSTPLGPFHPGPGTKFSDGSWICGVQSCQECSKNFSLKTKANNMKYVTYVDLQVHTEEGFLDAGTIPTPWCHEWETTTGFLPLTTTTKARSGLPSVTPLGGAAIYYQAWSLTKFFIPFFHTAILHGLLSTARSSHNTELFSSPWMFGWPGGLRKLSCHLRLEQAYDY